MNRLQHIAMYFMITMIPLFNSCFEEDDIMEPMTGDFIFIEQSIYDYQVYFDLSSRNEILTQPNSVWTLGFNTAPDGWQIKVNTSDFWSICRTGNQNYSELQEPGQDLDWYSDASSGNPDSTAVGIWFDVVDDDTLYSNEVFILGKYDGITYHPVYKFVLTCISSDHYEFKYGLLSDRNGKDIQITKDTNYNYVYFSMEFGKEVLAEPGKKDWDLVFNQYYTTLYTDEGLPTPYYVRGVFINPSGITVATDTLNQYLSIGLPDTTRYLFSNNQDIIGYEWKNVEIDEQSNSAIYKADPTRTYIIRDSELNYYKLRFIGYYNEEGLKGFPTFEYRKLID